MRLYIAITTLMYLLHVVYALPADLDVRAAAKPKLVVPAIPAKPTPNPITGGKAPKKVPCDPLSKYSVSWFIANFCMKGRPKPSTCLFYTYKLSLTARRYAKAHKPEMTTIWVFRLSLRLDLC